MKKWARWSDEEKEFLRENYQNLTNKQLGEKLERNPKSVSNKIGELGLQRTYGDEYTKSNLEMKEEDKIYLAGIIDGEGNVGIYQRDKNYHRPRLIIVNTDKELMDYLSKILEKNYHKRIPKNDSWKEKYIIDITSYRKVQVILEMILPYLIVKEKIARLVLKYIHLRMKDPIKSGYTETEEKIYHLNRYLNARKKESEEKAKKEIQSLCDKSPHELEISLLKNSK